MAAKKKAKKKTSKALAMPWQQRLAERAKAGKKPKEKAVTGDYISIKGGKFSLGGVKIGLNGKGLELDCICLGFIFEKSYYDTKFKEGEASAPACWALSWDEDTLEPANESPNKQCETTCEDCPMNEWGSGQGDGKACSDRRRLALAFEGEDGNIEIKLLNIPPTSLKNWKSFVNDLDAQGLEPMQVGLHMSFDEDYTGSASVPPIIFEATKEITGEKRLQALADMLEKADKLLETPHDPKNYTGGKSKKKAKKKTAKKKTSRRSKLS